MVKQCKTYVQSLISEQGTDTLWYKINFRIGLSPIVYSNVWHFLKHRSTYQPSDRFKKSLLVTEYNHCFFKLLIYVETLHDVNILKRFKLTQPKLPMAFKTKVRLPLLQLDLYLHVDLRNRRADFCTPARKTIFSVEMGLFIISMNTFTTCGRCNLQRINPFCGFRVQQRTQKRLGHKQPQCKICLVLSCDCTHYCFVAAGWIQGTPNFAPLMLDTNWHWSMCFDLLLAFFDSLIKLYLYCFDILIVCCLHGGLYWSLHPVIW